MFNRKLKAVNTDFEIAQVLTLIRGLNRVLKQKLNILKHISAKVLGADAETLKNI